MKRIISDKDKAGRKVIRKTFVKQKSPYQPTLTQRVKAADLQRKAIASKNKLASLKDYRLPPGGERAPNAPAGTLTVYAKYNPALQCHHKLMTIDGVSNYASLEIAAVRHLGLKQVRFLPPNEFPDLWFNFNGKPEPVVDGYDIRKGSRMYYLCDMKTTKGPIPFPDDTYWVIKTSIRQFNTLRKYNGDYFLMRREARNSAVTRKPLYKIYRIPALSCIQF